MPSRNTYRLTWVSLTLDVGYLFTAAPAKHSRCSLPWTRGISSGPPLLTLNVEQLLSALLRPRGRCSLGVGLLLSAAARTSDVGKLLSPLLRCRSLALWVAAPDLGRGELLSAPLLSVADAALLRVQLFATPWTVASQAPLSMGFSRQEYWSG